MHRHSITLAAKWFCTPINIPLPSPLTRNLHKQGEKKKGIESLPFLQFPGFSRFFFPSPLVFCTAYRASLKIAKNPLREKQAGYFLFTRVKGKEGEPRSAVAFPACFLIHTAARYDHLSKELAGIILSELPRGGGPRFMKHSAHHKQGLATYGYHRRTTGPTDAHSSVGDSEKCRRNYWIGYAHDIISD